MAMELKVLEYQTPSEIIFNFDELKNELAEKVESYKSLVYGENEIRLAKADKASLNKLKKALDDERKRREKEYLAPFTAFKAQINELIALIDAPIAEIDKQIKAAEEARKEQKMEIVKVLFADAKMPDWLTLESVFDSRWLNATYTAKQIEDDLAALNYKIFCDMRTLNSLPDFAFEATEEYKRTLDLNRAISEGQRLADIQKRKQAEAEQAQITMEQVQEEKPQYEAVPIPAKEEPKTWIKFEAHLTMTDAKALKEFFNNRGIEFRAI